MQFRGVQHETARLLGRLFEKAAREAWSGRKLAEQIGIPESSLRALAKGKRAPDHWMPQLRAAVERLGA